MHSNIQTALISECLLFEFKYYSVYCCSVCYLLSFSSSFPPVLHLPFEQFSHCQLFNSIHVHTVSVVFDITNYLNICLFSIQFKHINGWKGEINKQKITMLCQVSKNDVAESKCCHFIFWTMKIEPLWTEATSEFCHQPTRTQTSAPRHCTTVFNVLTFYRFLQVNKNQCCEREVLKWWIWFLWRRRWWCSTLYGLRPADVTSSAQLGLLRSAAKEVRRRKLEAGRTRFIKSVPELNP